MSHADLSTTKDQTGDSFVVLGKVIGFFGVKGWVKVHSDTDPRENIVSYSQWWLGDSKQRKPIGVRTGKRSGKNVVAQLAGIETREQAEPLLGKEISVKRSMLPELNSHEVYWTDIVGCTVEDVQGNTLGPVERLFDTGANDVMVVKDQRADETRLQTGGTQTADKDGKRVVEGHRQQDKTGEILIPWIRPSVITSIDLTTKRIVVDWDPDF